MLLSERMSSATVIAVNPTWTAKSPIHSPSARYFQGLAYDSARGVSIMFGGDNTGGSRLNDTWEYDGTDWRQIVTAQSPPGRVNIHYAMAFHAGLKRTVLFGGLTALAYANDTWEYDGANWKSIVPNQSPPGRDSHALVYDSRRNVVILFGGHDSSGALNDTWEYDGVTWQHKTPIHTPPGRWYVAAAFDETRGKMVIFGGTTNVGDMTINDTWEYDGTDWQQISTSTTPVKRASPAIAFDSDSGALAMFGGGQFSAVLEDLWNYDGTNWTQLTTGIAPSKRSMPLVYDKRRKVFVAFGGGHWLASANSPTIYGDTWELSFGAGQSTDIRLKFPLDLLSKGRRDGLDRVNSFFDHQYPSGLGTTVFGKLGEDGVLTLYTGESKTEHISARTEKGGCDLGRSCYDGHSGIDFQAPDNANIYAAHDGQASGDIIACTRNSNGNIKIPIYIIRVKQGRYQTRYLHVKPDALWQSFYDNPRPVKGGVETIAHVGNTGYPVCSSASHLHLDTLYDVDGTGNYQLVDPYGFNHTREDPWETLSKAKSVWMWESPQSIQQHYLPGNISTIASGPMSIGIGGSAVATDSQFYLSPYPDPSLDSLAIANLESKRINLAATVGVGSSYILTGSSVGGAPIIDFAEPVTVTTEYTDTDTVFININTLRLSEWNPLTASWDSIDSTLDIGNHLITSQITHPSVIMLRGEPTFSSPVIVSFHPQYIDTSVGVTLTINGQNFRDTPSVQIGYSLLSVSYVSPTQVTAYLPSGNTKGVYSIILRNPDSQITASQLKFSIFESVPGTTLFMPALLRDYIPPFTGRVELEPNNTIDTANGLLQSNVACIGFPDDLNDYYTFTTTTAGKVSVSLNGHIGANTNGLQLQLRDAGNKLIEFVFKAPFNINVANLPAGTYYARIFYAAPGPYSGSTPYSLQVVYP